MKRLDLAARSALLALTAAGALAATSGAALADVACNRYGECWHVSNRYTYYPPSLGVQFYDDDWARTHHHGHYHWRRDQDNDRGYYSHGRWHRFDHDHDHDGR
jgi:hypothetical protein